MNKPKKVLFGSGMVYGKAVQNLMPYKITFMFNKLIESYIFIISHVVKSV